MAWVHRDSICFHNKMRQIATIFFNVISYQMSWTILEEADGKLHCFLPNKSEVEMEVSSFLGDSVLVRSEKELGCCSQQMQWVILLSICYSLQLIIYKKTPTMFLQDGKESTNKAQARLQNIRRRWLALFCIYLFYFYGICHHIISASQGC